MPARLPTKRAIPSFILSAPLRVSTEKRRHQYLTAVRIEKAKELLETGTSVTEACFSVGFDSLGSFITLFKRRAGITPSEYRRRKLERKRQIIEKPLSFIPSCFADEIIRRKNSNFQEAK